jgi:CRISPR-associated endonuclease/helicase Cas3
MSRALNKAERLLQIEALLLAHPRGLTQAEIAHRLGVNRSTIYRYLPEITTRFPVYETDDGRLVLDRSSYLTQVRLTLHEALAVHLAARLMATRSDRQNPHAASALRKIGLALERLAPLISQHVQGSAEVMDGQSQRQDPVYLQVLEKITLAWGEGRKAQVWHWHEETGQVRTYIFSPYFIEPYAIGQTTHAIGWREPPGALRTFKIERIRRVELLAETYEIPGDFDAGALLAGAWGIMFGEELEEVRLRFAPRVVRRVYESIWHPSQQLEECIDGGCVLTVRVAHPLEMKPWIRGWGPDCEVLAPAWLRADVAEEMRRAAEAYGEGAK